MKNILCVVLVVFVSGCSLLSSSKNKNSVTVMAENLTSNYFRSKDFLVGDKINIITEAKIIGKSKSKLGLDTVVDLEILFNNVSAQRIDVQLDLIKYIHDDYTESFFAGPKILTLVPNSVERMRLKNLSIVGSSDVELVFVYSFSNNRRVKEIKLKRLSKEQYKNLP